MTVPTRLHQLEHPALLYSGLEDFLSLTVPYVAEGIDEEEAVFVVARGDFLPALRAELGPRVARARFADTHEWHPHPLSRLRAFHEFVSAKLEGGASRIRLAGEPVWPEGPPELIREWQRYESVLNAVFAPFPVSLMCLYDASNLDPSIVASARRTHPTVHGQGVVETSMEFEPPSEFLRRSNPKPPVPPARAARMKGVLDVGAARRFVREQALLAGVEPARAEDLCIAANEILTNAIVYAGRAVLWTWPEGESFICQIEDHGGGIADPLAGYLPPSEEWVGNRGLWMARQLVDILRIVSGHSGTVVRLCILCS